MSHKQSILVTTVAYPSSDDSLNGTFVKDFVECISSKYNVTVLHCRKLSQNSKESPGLRIEETEHGKIFHIFLNDSFIPWTLSIILGFVKGLNIIEKQHISIDIIHGHFFPSVLPFLFKFRKKPVVLTEHWSGFPLKQLNKVNNFLAKLAINRCKIVCPVSIFLMKAMKEYGINGNFQIIPNPINQKKFYYKKKKPSSIKKILFVGRQIPERNTPVVLNAIKEISKKFTHIHLDIVGNGSHLEQYKEFSNKLGLTKFVTFHGKVKKSDIVNYIHAADFSIIPAGIETQSVFLNESMACGKPILAANTGGPTEYIDKNIGMLIDPTSVDEWKNGIMLMIAKLDNFDPIKISQIAMDNFSYTSVLKKYQKIYDSIKN